MKSLFSKRMKQGISCSTSAFLSLILFGALFTGCEKTTLTENEMRLVEKNVKSYVIAQAFDDKYVDVWNNHLTDQLTKASEQYWEKLSRTHNAQRSGMFAGMYEWVDDMARASGSHNTMEYKSEWSTHVIEVYEEQYKAVRSQMAEDIKNDYKKVDRRLDVMYDIYHTTDDAMDDELRDKLEDLDIPRTLPYREWYGIDRTEDYVQNVRWIENMLRDLQEFDVTSIAVGDFNSVDHMTRHFEYFLYSVVSGCFNQVKDIKVDYIVKEPETVNSFQVGFSNGAAMLCTFTEDESNVRVTYESIEYDQTCIGQGLQ